MKQGFCSSMGCQYHTSICTAQHKFNVWIWGSANTGVQFTASIFGMCLDCKVHRFEYTFVPLYAPSKPGPLGAAAPPKASSTDSKAPSHTRLGPLWRWWLHQQQGSAARPPALHVQKGDMCGPRMMHP